MRIRNAWLSVGVSIAMFAGCQSEAVRLQVKDQRVPAEVGLRVDSFRDFGQEGILASQPQNLGRSYLERGGLNLALFRVTNVTNETRELYPVIPSPGQEAKVALSQYYWGSCSRARYSCMIGLLELPPESELVSVYDSEFDVVGASFEFESGASESIAFSVVADERHLVRLRAGESAVFQVRLRLHAGTPMAFTDRIALVGISPGSSFMPLGLNFEPATRNQRPEILLGLTMTSRMEATLLVRNPVTAELNPIHIIDSEPPQTMFSGMSTAVGIPFPPPVITRRINGLAEQF